MPVTARWTPSSPRRLRGSGFRLYRYLVGDHEDKQHQSENDEPDHGDDLFTKARGVMVVDHDDTVLCTALMSDLQTAAVTPAGGAECELIVRQDERTVCELAHTSLSERRLILGRCTEKERPT